MSSFSLSCSGHGGLDGLQVVLDLGVDPRADHGGVGGSLVGPELAGLAGGRFHLRQLAGVVEEGVVLREHLVGDAIGPGSLFGRHRNLLMKGYGRRVRDP